MAHKNKSNWSPYKARKAAQNQAPVGQGRGHRKPTENFSLEEVNDRLRDLFDRHGMAQITHDQRHQLARLHLMLMAEQHERNFTRLLTLRDVGLKHFVDCLIVPQVLREAGHPLRFPLLDVGTGPGFPGVPLKILFPLERIILAEGVQKRVEFLKLLRDELQLPRLDILGRNINDEVFLPVQAVITRAVEDASNTLGNVIQCLQTGGQVVLMKGPNCTPEIQPALDQWGEYYRLQADLAYVLPNTTQERRLLVFEKIKAAPLPDFEERDLAWERQHGS